MTYKTEALSSKHNRKQFDCGVASLTRYFQNQASQDQKRKVAACFVLSESEKVLGYYTLSSASVGLDKLPSKLQKKLPRYPQIPATLMGRLAIDQSARGRRHGEMLLFDAMFRALDASRTVASFALLVDALDVEKGDVTGVHTSAGLLTADKYVVAMGSYSPLLLAQIGIKVPVYPIKGYSLTLPIVDESRAPVSTVMDETYKVAVTRFDDRIRVGGTAEITGYDLGLPEKRRASVDHVVDDLFHGGGDLSKAEFWSGLRPMTPDSVPVLGETKYKSLFLNTGHGTLGWTMSLGSSRYVADLMCGREPHISTAGLSVARYS